MYLEDEYIQDYEQSINILLFIIKFLVIMVIILIFIKFI